MIKWLLKILGFTATSVVESKGQVDVSTPMPVAVEPKSTNEVLPAPKAKKPRKPRQRKASSKKS